MLSDALTQHAVVIYVLIAARTLWMLPLWGQRVLAFLRDIDDYRHRHSGMIFPVFATPHGGDVRGR